MRLETPSFLRTAYEHVALSLGASHHDAAIFSRCYLKADLRGHDTQGIAILPRTIEALRRGRISFGREPLLVGDGQAYAVLDGNQKPGTVTATLAMNMAIDKAADHGIGTVWVRNCEDAGMLANYSELAVERDQIGMVMANGSPLVAAWGGRSAIFGTNPMSYAIPTSRYRPIVFDGSMSPVSAGGVRRAFYQGRLLEGDYLVTDDGRLTNDPSLIFGGHGMPGMAFTGAIASLGPKGFGWLVLVEVLAGILAGAKLSLYNAPGADPSRPRTAGLFAQAINVGMILSIGAFKARVDDMVEQIKNSAPAGDINALRLPGEHAQIEEERRSLEGVPVEEGSWSDFVEVARDVGVDIDTLRDPSRQ